MSASEDSEGQAEEGNHYVVPKSDLEEGKRVVTDVKGREVAIFNIDNEYYAIGSHCPHMGGPCAEGLLTGYFGADEDGKLEYSRENEIVCCPWHGWEFDIKNGNHLGGTKKRLLTYDVIVEDGDIYISI